MSNITITNCDIGQIEVQDGKFLDETLVFGAGGTVKAGTLLGRVEASSKLAPFAPGASDGSEEPLAVLTYDVTAAGAGDVPVRVLGAGVVNAQRLIIAADGDGSNITPAILDKLRSYGIIALPVDQLAAFDNQ